MAQAITRLSPSQSPLRFASIQVHDLPTMNQQLLRLAAALSLLAAATLPCLAQDNKAPAQADADLDPYEWVVETYQFPVDDLARGFASAERGALKAPRLPDADASDEEIREFMKKSSSVVTHYLEMAGLGLPKGSLVLFDPATSTITARLPRIAQASLHFTAEARTGLVEKYLEFIPHLIEAPAERVRAAVAKASKEPDHVDILNELLGEVEAGNASLIFEGRLEVRSGQRAKIEQVVDRSTPADLSLGPDDEIAYTIDDVEEGTTLELDAVIGSDEQTVDVNIGLTHHYAPSTRRQLRFLEVGDTKLSQAVTDTYSASLSTQITMRDKRTKLIGVWKPEMLPGDANPADVLHCAFLSAKVIRVLPLVNPVLEQYIRDHGAAVDPIPEGQPEFEQVAEEIPEGMIVRRFVIPPTFLNAGGGGGGSPVDPFSPAVEAEPTFTIKATAKDILRAAGIGFPEGSSANYLPQTSTLVIRNTPENIQLVEAYMMSLKGSVERTVPVTMHVIEGPAAEIQALLEQTRGLPDHTPTWEKLQDNKAIRIVTTQWLECRSGQRAMVQAGRQFTYPVGAGIAAGGKPETKAEGEAVEAGEALTSGYAKGSFETRLVGTRIEVDPVVGADGQTIDMNFAVEYDYALPSTSGEANREKGIIALDGPTSEFHQAEVSAGSIFRSGMMRMVSVWRPEPIQGREQNDVLQALFLGVDLVSVEEVE